MDLGKKLKKAELQKWIKFKMGFMALLSLVVGLFLLVMSFINKEKENSNLIMYIGLMVAASSLIYIVRYFQEKKLAGSYTFFTEGFSNDISGNEMRYDDIRNYYSSMFKMLKEDVSYLIIEGNKGTEVLNSRLEKGKEYFLESYVPYIIPKEIEGIKNGEVKEFGVMSRMDTVKSKFALTENKVIENLKNISVTKKITVSLQGLRIGDEKYSWNEISEGRITRLKTFIIKDKDGRKIFDNPVIFIQRPEILEKLIGKFVSDVNHGPVKEE